MNSDQKAWEAKKIAQVSDQLNRHFIDLLLIGVDVDAIVTEAKQSAVKAVAAYNAEVEQRQAETLASYSQVTK